MEIQPLGCRFDKSIKAGENWFIFVFLGSGKNFQEITIENDIYKKIETSFDENKEMMPEFKDFVKDCKKLCKDIPSSELLQKLYEEDNRNSEYLDLETFFKKGSELIQNIEMIILQIV